MKEHSTSLIAEGVIQAAAIDSCVRDLGGTHPAYRVNTADAESLAALLHEAQLLAQAGLQESHLHPVTLVVHGPDQRSHLVTVGRITIEADGGTRHELSAQMPCTIKGVCPRCHGLLLENGHAENRQKPAQLLRRGAPLAGIAEQDWDRCGAL